jgi:CBS domain-containing protein
MISTIIAGRPVISAASDMTVRAACKMMAEKRIGAVLVVDDNRITGIFTERDVLNKVLAGCLDPDSTVLAQVMVRDPQTIRADKPLGYALQFMVDGGFRHVPVVDTNGAPLGMVSARDALGADMVQLERNQQLREHLEENIA